MASAGLPALADQESTGNGALEEIIVTAQRRAQSLQEVPISVTALDSEMLNQMGIRGLSDVALRTPGISMGSFNVGQPQVYIRGIGSNTRGAGSDSSVVVFMDEVYLARTSATTMELFDLDRVEVLRGPQGTLYGKNAIGGAINYVTSRPSDEPMGKAELEVGNLNLLVFRALVSGPLSDRVSGKLAFVSHDRDGYVTSVPLGVKMNDVNSLGFRGALEFDASDDLMFLLSADYSKDRQSGPGRMQLPFTTADAQLFLPAGNCRGAGNGCPPGQIVRAQRTYDASLQGNYRYTFADNEGYQNSDIWGLTGRIEWQVGDGELTSITAFRRNSYEMSDDIPGSGLQIFPGVDSTRYDTEDPQQFTQELRYSAASFDDRLKWVLGAFYLREDIEREEANFVALAGGAVKGTDYTFQDNTTTSMSGFLDGTWSFTDTLNLTLGGRYTSEKKDMHASSIPGLTVRPYDVNTDETWSNFSPRAVLGFKFSPDLFMYASAAEGFKSGGWDGFAANATAATQPFDEELATAYELGVKSEWLERRLRLNLAAFYTDYEDLQVLERFTTQDNPLGVVITQNAANATVKGAELEFALRQGGFSISGFYAYLNTEAKEFASPTDLRNGTALRNAPENAYGATISYDWSLGNTGTINLRYDINHKDRMYQDPLNIEGASIAPYTVQDARIGYTAGGGQWELAAWVRNLSDEEYLLHNFPLNPYGNAGTAAPPQTYGATFSINFGGPL